MRKNVITGIVITAILCGLIACNGGKTIKYNDIAGPNELRELESVDLSVATDGGTGLSVDWRVDPSDAGEFSPGVGLETTFISSPGIGSRNVTINAIMSTDQHDTVIKKKSLMINDNTGWVTAWECEDSYMNKFYFLETGPDGTNYLLGDFEELEIEIDGVVETIESKGELDSVLLAVDPSGTVIWYRIVSEGPAYEPSQALTLSTNGDLIVSARLTAIEIERSELSRYTSSGELVWEVITPGHTDASNLDSQGNIYIAGKFLSTIDFDPGPGVDWHSAAGSGSYLCKFSPQGDYLWGRSWESSPKSSQDWIADLAVDNQDSVYVVGHFGDECDFDPGAGENILFPISYSSGYISRFDRDGEHISAWVMGGEYGGGFCWRISISDQGDIYLLGNANGEMNFSLGPDPVIYETSRMYLAKYNSQLEVQWVDLWDWGWPGEFGNLLVNDQGGVLISGYFSGNGSYDFDPGPGEWLFTPAAYPEGFILRLDTQGGFISADTYGEFALWFYDTDQDQAGNLFATGYQVGGREIVTPEGYSVLPGQTSNFLQSFYQ